MRFVKCGLPAEMRVPAENWVTRRDAGTQSHAGKNPQKPETRTPVTRNYPKPITTINQQVSRSEMPDAWILANLTSIAYHT